MNGQKAMTLPLKEEEASRLDPKAKVKVKVLTQVIQQTSTLMAFLARSSLLSGTPKYSRLPPSAVTANVMERARPHNRSKKNKKRLFSASFGRNTTILFVKYTDMRIYGKLTCLQV
jgi:hypothetical protein